MGEDHQMLCGVEGGHLVAMGVEGGWRGGVTRFQSEWKEDSPIAKGSGKGEGVTKC